MRIEKKIVAAVYIPAHVETIKIYEFDELAQDVQRKLIVKEFNNLDIDFIVDEWLNTVKAIGELLGDQRPHYEVGYGCHNYLHFNNHNEPDEELTGIRAMAWIQNNWINYAYKGKYFSTPFRKCEKSPEHPAGIYYKHRYSKIMLQLDNCPFTGVCYDCCFGEAWNEYKEEIRQGKQLTVNDFVSILQEKLIDDITQEIDYRYSDEGIKKELSENEYYKNGEVA